MSALIYLFIYLSISLFIYSLASVKRNDATAVLVTVQEPVTCRLAQFLVSVSPFHGHLVEAASHALCAVIFACSECSLLFRGYLGELTNTCSAQIPKML